MAKNGVDGVYTADPRRDPSATRLERLTYMDALNRGLTVMDSTALTFCMDNQMPIIVFNALQSRAIERIILGEEVGSLVSHER
jgi:uridylate kinase